MEKGKAMVRKLAQVALVVLVVGLIGCSTARTINQNVEEDIQVVLSRVHIDVQEFINHPERWSKVVDSLCEDGMILAKDCVQLKALFKARDIALGLRESRIHPWLLKPRLLGPRPLKPEPRRIAS